LDYTLLTELPETPLITKLEKLEHIRFSNRDDFWGTMWTIPQGISKMKALHVLRRVTLGNDDSEASQEVGELEQLQVFVVSLDDRKASVDEDVMRNLALSISKMCSLRWLWIGHRRSDNNSKQKQVMNFLHHLPTPPRLLQTLWITGDVDGLPSWISTLAHLVTFTILDTTLAGALGRPV
jgi:disease resistance protein RPM1